MLHVRLFCLNCHLTSLQETADLGVEKECHIVKIKNVSHYESSKKNDMLIKNVSLIKNYLAYLMVKI